jgi:hypothetical protein
MLHQDCEIESGRAAADDMDVHDVPPLAARPGDTCERVPWRTFN